MAGANVDRVILVVEDDPKDEQLTIRALEKAHIVNPVVVAHDGLEALDYLFARGAHAARPASAEPQVILLDLRLPKVDGLEVLRALRADERTRLLPVVVLTASNEERDLVQSLELGANSVVRKPVVFSQFVEAVRQLGIYWVLLNQAAPT